MEQDLSQILLPTPHRQVVLDHDWDGSGFVRISEEQRLSPDACSMRAHRALPPLAVLIRRLEDGQAHEILVDGEAHEASRASLNPPAGDRRILCSPTNMRA